MCHVPPSCSTLTPCRLQFEVLFAHCDGSHIENSTVRGIVASALVSRSSSLSDVERGAVLIGHRLRAYLDENEDNRAKNVLSLLTQIVENARGKYGPDEYKQLLAHIFDVDAVKRLCEETLSPELRQGDGLRRPAH